MAGITNYKLYAWQEVEMGFVIVTQDCEGGMLDIHDRRPVVLESEDALRWMAPDTPIEEAVHIAQTRSIPTEGFMWWKVEGGEPGRPEQRWQTSIGANRFERLKFPVDAPRRFSCSA